MSYVIEVHDESTATARRYKVELAKPLAVATLDEACEGVWNLLDASMDTDQIEVNLSESGGTISLPDGRVIKVRHASWDDLVGPEGWDANSTEESVLDDFNNR
jgi:hypothetical protein